MKLNERTILKAMAQVFKDFPKTFTIGVHARDADNRPVATDSNRAVVFCALGFLERANHEGLITHAQALLARGRLNDKCTISIADTNDSEGGRLKIIKAAKEASK